jgi:hypothetical protein
VKKKYWSKLVPNATCEVIGSPDAEGLSPAYVSAPDIKATPFATAVNLNEWSAVEVVPVPLSVPDTGYLVLFGPDPDLITYRYFERETDAAVAASSVADAFGYVPVTIKRYAMITTPKP